MSENGFLTEIALQYGEYLRGIVAGAGASFLIENREFLEENDEVYNFGCIVASSTISIVRDIETNEEILLLNFINSDKQVYNSCEQFGSYVNQDLELIIASHQGDMYHNYTNRILQAIAMTLMSAGFIYIGADEFFEFIDHRFMVKGVRKIRNGNKLSVIFPEIIGMEDMNLRATLSKDENGYFILKMPVRQGRNSEDTFGEVMRVDCAGVIAVLRNDVEELGDNYSKFFDMMKNIFIETFKEYIQAKIN